ncbi:olfactory receptor 10A2-like [Pelodiscus sinensis]|uniref:olfactory receptor 10A2-like n=1 Tax=Pelodiscus sinensis TaxID=13735 RepID=UPI000704155D|nr:olfactory receptor 10A2-like [Pelodiscus sinensis]|eukprot:XP_014429945.1 olfactory receptor 10A2-like [Pelodiscus sinensis]
MEKAERRNQTLIMEFILLGFGDVGDLQPLLFLVFLVIYIVTVAGNILIVVLVVTDPQLRTPMYFFVGNLSCLETCYSSTILPRLLASLLTGDRTVSVKRCLVQTYFFSIIAMAENLLLAAMSYDRYLAICHPLRYAALMNGRVCCQLVAGSWLYSFLVVGVLNSFLFPLTFCNAKEIDHYFCDFSPMIRLSCDAAWTLQLATLTISAIGTVVPLLLTLASYVCIITTILRIPSSTGRQKAFSTCSSHLMVVTIIYISLIIVYVFPSLTTSTVLHKVFSLFYTVLNPMINPIIYSLRNKEVKESLRKAIGKVVTFRNKHRIW